MFRKATILVVSALAALTAAQPEIQSSNGAINMETREGVTIARRQEISVFDLSNVIATIQAENSNFRIQSQAENSNLRIQHAAELSNLRDHVDNRMTAVGGSESPLALGVQAIANDMQARTSDLLTLANSNANGIESMQAQVAAAGTAMNTMANSMAQASVVAADAIDARVDSAMAEMSSVLAANNAASRSTLTANNAAAQSTMAAVTAAVSNSIAAVTSSQTAMNSSIFTAIAARAPAKRHTWIGGCSGTNNGGWSEDCLDRVAQDTALPKFRKQNNNRMIALVQGFFRVVKYTITNSCNWTHHAAHVNGRSIANTHGYNGYNYNQWKDIHNNWLFRADRNHWFSTRAWAGCNHHATYSYGSHSRIEYSYEGLIA